MSQVKIPSIPKMPERKVGLNFKRKAILRSNEAKISLSEINRAFPDCSLASIFVHAYSVQVVPWEIEPLESYDKRVQAWKKRLAQVKQWHSENADLVVAVKKSKRKQAWARKQVRIQIAKLKDMISELEDKLEII